MSECIHEALSQAVKLLQEKLVVSRYPDFLVLSALDPSTGTIKWIHPTKGPIIPSVTVANGLVVAAADDLLWEYATGAQIYAAPAFVIFGAGLRSLLGLC